MVGMQMVKQAVCKTVTLETLWVQISPYQLTGYRLMVRHLFWEQDNYGSNPYIQTVTMM